MEPAEGGSRDEHELIYSADVPSAKHWHEGQKAMTAAGQARGRSLMRTLQPNHIEAPYISCPPCPA